MRLRTGNNRQRRRDNARGWRRWGKATALWLKQHGPFVFEYAAYSPVAERWEP